MDLKTKNEKPRGISTSKKVCGILKATFKPADASTENRYSMYLKNIRKIKLTDTETRRTVFLYRCLFSKYLIV
jgi:hypothetical protein